MKIYLVQGAGAIQNLVEHNALRSALFSYHYLHSSKTVLAELEYAISKDLDCFIDSGAFSAFTKGVSMDFKKYADFLAHYSGKITVASNIDDMFKDEQKSYDNQKALEALGAKIQPVFHTREDPKWLLRYIDEGYDYIFIGGMVPETTAWLREWLDWLWKNFLTHKDGSPKVKIHGFGLTTTELIIRYPWYSVDSTSWLMTSRFGGGVFVRNGTVHKVVFSELSPEAKKIGGRHYWNLSSKEKRIVDGWLEPLGITAEQCATAYQYRDIVCARGYIDMEQLASPVLRLKEEGLFSC